MGSTVVDWNFGEREGGEPSRREGVGSRSHQMAKGPKYGPTQSGSADHGRPKLDKFEP